VFDFLDDRGSTGFGLASNAAGLARSGGAVGSGGGGGGADQHANYLDRENNVPPEAAVSAFVCVAKLKLCALAAARHAADARADTVAGEVFAALDPTNTQFVSLHDVQRWLQQHAGCAALTAQDLFLIFGASSSSISSRSNGNDIKIREELTSLPPAHTEARDPVFGGEQSDGEDVRPSSGADEPEVAHLMDRASFRAALGLPPHRAVAALLHRLVRVVHVRAANRAVRLAQARRLGSGTGHSSCRDRSRGGLTVTEAALLKRRFRAACVAGGVAALDRPAFKQLEPTSRRTKTAVRRASTRALRRRPSTRPSPSPTKAAAAPWTKLSSFRSWRSSSAARSTAWPPAAAACLRAGLRNASKAAASTPLRAPCRRRRARRWPSSRTTRSP
jgi:hypothetical protein